ncbi:hypothetical protein ACFOGI_06390 [Virgibacillus xinjiangensis]|uniref:D-glucuronyl C5-epimerase C-terminal domain-containing protein n=1 Tax=Virgibacillus xinjiangensis TaxID=393090 RepID=A0ABV7CTT2_9BACI
MRPFKTLIILLVNLIALLFFVFFVAQPSEKPIATKEEYDEYFYRDFAWSINNFPTNSSTYNGAQYAWGWSNVGNSLVNMYKATGDPKYLEYFAQQAEYIFTQTDEKLGIESFSGTGLSLPGWSDGGYYTSGKFNYIYPVHTGMIILPILRFVDTVKSNELSEYDKIANQFLKSSGDALAIHNQDTMWKDFSDTEGFYLGHQHGEGVVSEAGKIGVPNRISIYIAAAGLYDKLTKGSIYTERIEKSLNYFKYSLFKFDKDFNTYYWSYYEEQNIEKPWEDISHARITIYGIYILHEEAGFSVFNKQDLDRLANIVFKVVDEKSSPPLVRKYIHKRDEENKAYYSMDENPYYSSILRWSFLGIYNEEILEVLKTLSSEMKNDEKATNLRLRLNSIASYLYTKEKLN